MKAFAQFIHKELNLPGNPAEVQDICEGTDRYCMYKVGPVLSISVSIGSQHIEGWLTSTVFSAGLGSTSTMTVMRAKNIYRTQINAKNLDPNIQK